MVISGIYIYRVEDSNLHKNCTLKDKKSKFVQLHFFSACF